MNNATLILGLLVSIMWRLHGASDSYGSSLLADAGSLVCFAAAVLIGGAALELGVDNDGWAVGLLVAQAINATACAWMLTRPTTPSSDGESDG